jgi:hypothetical protein
VSMLQVLDTTLNAMQDPSVGVEAKMQALMALPGVPQVRAEFTFGKWAIPSGALKDARQAYLVVRPSAGEDETKIPQKLHRDNRQVIDIAAEFFGADPEQLQDMIAVGQAAVLMVLDGLREFSDGESPAGTIIEVVDPVRTRYGEFEGATSGGFISTAVITERSAQ